MIKKLTRIIALTMVLVFLLASAAMAAIPNNAIIFGGKAYDLSLLDDQSMVEEILNAFVHNGNSFVYKTPEGNLINPDAQAINKDTLPEVEYKDDKGNITRYDAKDGDEISPPVTIDISGEWRGYLLLDGLGAERTSGSIYVLNIIQNNNLLSASLSLPVEFGFNSPINFTGKISNDSTLSMNGFSGNTELNIYGTWQKDKSLEIALEGIEQEIQFVLFYKEEHLPTISLNNTLKLEKKLGDIGTGRSIILVHGMDDNAESWDEMLDYFDDHEIDETNNVWVFQYDWKLHINVNGKHMKHMISEKQSAGEITQDPIIIAHSMGGLVSRSYVILSSGNFHRLVTLSTPHLGSDLTHIAPYGDETGVGDLLPGHPFLDNLNSDRFEKTQRSKYWLLNGRVGTYPSCYKLGIPTCYHWHHPMPTNIEKVGHGTLDKPNDGMVTNASARFTGNKYYDKDKNVHRVDTFEWIDHKQLNKDDRICKWVKDFINDHQ
ncbi:MAG TPA: hypothetical protein DCK87_01820 [Desulfotomaculum sp.]|nr:hypothetical protein [Desulfotomaculum sp.]